MKVCVARKCLNRRLFTFKNEIRFFSILLALLVAGRTEAQKAGEGFTAATNEVTKYFSLGVTLMYAIGAVVGIVGAIKVYNKWNSGDQDTGKVASSWLGSCIFLVVVATILKGFFGV